MSKDYVTQPLRSCEQYDPAGYARMKFWNAVFWLAIAALLLAIVPEAKAQTYLTVPGVSYHGDRSVNWNEKNPGLGFEHDGMIAGYYRNSYHRNTWYAGFVWRPLETRYLRAGLMAAAATGYSTPVIVAPTVNIGTDEVSVDIIGAPTVGKGTTFYIGAQLRIRLWQ